jgi:hypothetical protein
MVILAGLPAVGSVEEVEPTAALYVRFEAHMTRAAGPKRPFFPWRGRDWTGDE